MEADTRCALYRADSGTWRELPDPDAAACAMAETKPLLAVHRTDGGVAVYDAATGEQARAFDSPLPGVSVTKLCFSDGDRLLLAFTASGTLAVFDAESGALLSRTDLGERFLSFKANARYDVFEDAAGDRLLVIYENTLYTESVCIVVDRGSWTCVGAYSGVIAYAQASDEVLLLPFGAGLYRMPLLNTEGLCRLAREFLARG
jgi:WD40 repeat protein